MEPRAALPPCAAAALAVVITGCGARVALDTSGAGGTTITTSVTNPTTGTGGAATSCDRTFDTVSINLLGTSPTLGCDAPTPQTIFAGTVTASAPIGFTIDTCPPGTGCDPQTITVDTYAPGLAPSIPPGTFVSVAVAFAQQPWGCSQTVLVTNLPTFGGAVNPTSPDPLLWLAAADGTLATSPASPFQLSATGDCPATGPDGVHDFVLQVTPLAPGASPIVVSMGQGVVGTLPSGETWIVRDLRSFRDETLPASAADKDFAYWIVGGK